MYSALFISDRIELGLNSTPVICRCDKAGVVLKIIFLRNKCTFVSCLTEIVTVLFSLQKPPWGILVNGKGKPTKVGFDATRARIKNIDTDTNKYFDYWKQIMVQDIRHFTVLSRSLDNIHVKSWMAKFTHISTCQFYEQIVTITARMFKEWAENRSACINNSIHAPKTWQFLYKMLFFMFFNAIFNVF